VITNAPQTVLLAITNIKKIELARRIARIPLVTLVIIPQIFVLLAGRGNPSMKELAGLSVHHPCLILI
jgi:hypothetical protein